MTTEERWQVDGFVRHTRGHLRNNPILVSRRLYELMEEAAKERAEQLKASGESVEASGGLKLGGVPLVAVD